MEGDGALFRALVQGTPDVLVVASADGIVRFANPAVRTLFGWAPEEMVGINGFTLVHPEDVPIAEAAMREALSGSEPSSPCVVRFLRKDGSWVYTETIGQSWIDDPEIRGVLLHARDVSDRIRASERLEDSEARFRAIFEQVNDGVVLVDAVDKTVVDANLAACALFARDRQEVLGARVEDLLGTEDAQRDGVAIRRRDGSVKYVDWTSSPLDLPGSSLVLGVLRDVTAPLETERAKERFFAMIAHELRTPVAVLKSSIDVLRTQLAALPADDQRALLDVQKEEIDRLARIVSDVLDLAAIQSGRLSLRVAPTALAPLVASAAARVATQFGKKPSLDLHTVDALVDLGRFEQVVTNLLDNAYRHGGQSVTVRLRDDDSHAVLTIVDDGPGIPRAIRDKLFDRYSVFGEHPTSGIGIGLWLSRQLVVAMRGAIGAEAPSDGGTAITVRVPRPDATARAPTTTET